MNVIEYAIKEEKFFEANFNGKRRTTFYYDLSIAEFIGGSNAAKKAVEETYRRIVKHWKTDVKYFTEFVCVLNIKCWEHYNRGNEELSRVYSDLYYKANDLAYSTYEGKDLEYYFNMTN